MFRRIAIVALCLPALCLTGCFRQARVIPTGVQTVSGVVKPVALSLVRRGTHMLMNGSESLYYLESPKINLRDFEGRDVTVHGMAQANTDPADIPVLVVDAVEGGVSQLGRTWSIPSLNVSIDTPREWQGKIVGEGAHFTATGSVEPILTVFLEGEDRLVSPGQTSSAPDLTVSSFALGSRRAVRLVNDRTGSERVQIDLRPFSSDPASDILTLLFLPSSEAALDADAWKILKEDIVRSLVFSGDSSSSFSSHGASLAPLSGSGAGMPCGGEAGILCPQGYYCEITDVKANVGRCKGL